MYIYMYIYISIDIHTHIYIYIYRPLCNLRSRGGEPTKAFCFQYQFILESSQAKASKPVFGAPSCATFIICIWNRIACRAFFCAKKK